MSTKLKKQINSILVLQRCIRGFQARMKYTEILWQSFQEEEEEQRKMVERHMSEGMLLVQAAEDEKSQRELEIFEKSTEFVERDRQAGAIIILQRAVRLTALARQARARVKERKEMLARAAKEEAKAEDTAAAATATEKAGPAPEESGQRKETPAATKQKNADASAKVELPLIKKKNIPPPPAGKPKKKAPAKELSKLEIRQSLSKLNQKRQKLIRSLARALKTKGSDLHELQRELKSVSIEIQQLLAMQSRAAR